MAWFHDDKESVPNLLVWGLGLCATSDFHASFINKVEITYLVHLLRISKWK